MASQLVCTSQESMQHGGKNRNDTCSNASQQYSCKVCAFEHRLFLSKLVQFVLDYVIADAAQDVVVRALSLVHKDPDQPVS